MEKQGQLPAHLLAVFPDQQADASAALHGEQLDVEMLAGLSLADLKIAGTPTLLLVNPKGRVLRVWEGQLPTKDEQQVVNVIRAQP